MEIIECTVQKIKGKFAYILVTKSQECEGCKACAFGKDGTISMPAIDDIGCKTGDRVLVEMPQKRIKAAPIYLYAIPLLLLLVAALIGNIFSQTAAIIASLSTLIVSVLMIWFIDKRYRKNKDFMPLIIKIINVNEGEK